MKKTIVGTAAVVVAAAAFRRFGPTLGRRAMSTCHEMFELMTEAFPPKRMMSGIEEIREQNARILRHLEQDHRRTALLAAH